MVLHATWSSVLVEADVFEIGILLGAVAACRGGTLLSLWWGEAAIQNPLTGRLLHMSPPTERRHEVFGTALLQLTRVVWLDEGL